MGPEVPMGGAGGPKRPAYARVGRLLEAARHGFFSVIRVEVEGWPGAAPGQFAMLRHQGSCRFLPRAFSVHAEDAAAAPPVVEFLVAPVGPGSGELAASGPGGSIDVLGPLGQGFPPPLEIVEPGGRLVIAAGGVGIAPFRHLLRKLGERESGGAGASGFAPAIASLDVLVLLGFRDHVQAEAAELVVETGKGAGDPGFRAEVVTEDGHLGRRGLVTTLLEEELRTGDSVFACGASLMCRAVWDLCLRKEVRDVWFSLEAPMACGTGSCHGCVIPTSDGDLAKVCREGPVFPGREVFGDLAGRRMCDSGEEEGRCR